MTRWRSAGSLPNAGFSLSAECSCSPVGSLSTLCDPVTGQCPCRPHFHGLTCDVCSKGYWKPPQSDVCEPCGCDPTGSTSDTCDQVRRPVQVHHFNTALGCKLRLTCVETLLETHVSFSLRQQYPHKSLFHKMTIKRQMLVLDCSIQTEAFIKLSLFSRLGLSF